MDETIRPVLKSATAMSPRAPSLSTRSLAGVQGGDGKCRQLYSKNNKNDLKFLKNIKGTISENSRIKANLTCHGV